MPRRLQTESAAPWCPPGLALEAESWVLGPLGRVLGPLAGCLGVSRLGSQPGRPACPLPHPSTKEEEEEEGSLSIHLSNRGLDNSIEMSMGLVLVERSPQHSRLSTQHPALTTEPSAPSPSPSALSSTHHLAGSRQSLALPPRTQPSAPTPQP